MMFPKQAEIPALREYQEQALDGLRALFREGKRRVMLVLPTGAGKTRVAAEMLRLAGERGNRCAFVAERRVLVKQTSAVLTGYGLRHGVWMASDTRDTGERLTVCSAQTLERRGLPDGLDLVILDEAHIQRPLERTLLAAGVRVVGLTATPFRTGRAAKVALHQFYGEDSVVSATTADRLTDDGFLVGTRAFVPKGDNKINRRNLQIAGNGEYTGKSMRDETIRIVDGLVREYAAKRELAEPVPRALAFVDSVDSAEALQEALCAAGYRFGILHYKASVHANREALEGLRAGVLEGLVSVDMLTRGLDVPEANIGIFARPYRRSFAGHIQEVGRILRPAPGKGRAIVMDAAGNWRRFASRRDRLFRAGPPSGFPMPPKRVVEEEEWPTTKTCPSCGAEIPIAVRECPECGHVFEGKKKRRETVEGMEEWWSPSLVWRVAAVLSRRRGLADEDRREFGMAACQHLAGGRYPVRRERRLDVRPWEMSESDRECAEAIEMDGPGWAAERSAEQAALRQAAASDMAVGEWRTLGWRRGHRVFGIIAVSGLPEGSRVRVRTRAGGVSEHWVGPVWKQRPAGSLTRCLYRNGGNVSRPYHRPDPLGPMDAPAGPRPGWRRDPAPRSPASRALADRAAAVLR